MSHRPPASWTLIALSLGLACGDDGRADPTGSPAGGPAGDPSGDLTDATGTATTSPTPTGDTPTGSASSESSASDPTGPVLTSSDTTAADPCGACDDPHQQCIEGECVTGCQGQAPDPCGPDQVCDVITGDCLAPDAACTLTGPSVACDTQQCGPGTACDGAGACIPVAPCADVACTGEGACWGSLCGDCERSPGCSDPAIELLNGPFSADISAIDFADDCTAWAVTVSGGQEFVRRMTSAGELSSFGAIGDFDLGEVRVLRRLTVPQLTVPFPFGSEPAEPIPVEGYGEVAVTYICCPTCGSCANNPEARGVAHLVEDNPNMPLPIIIYAEPTQGTGPFGNIAVDGGPQGLTWGEDRVLYVGNALADGVYSSADLEAATVDELYTFPVRVTASAPISNVHNLVALLGGDLHRFNTVTHETEFVVDLMSDVTNLSQDPFSGHVYASLASLEVVRVHPFSGEVESFAMMPAKGRVAVSPSGKLWFAPVAYLNKTPIISWDLPASL